MPFASPLPRRRSTRPLPLVAVGALVLGLSGSATASTIPTSASSVSRGVCTTSLTDPLARAAAFQVRVHGLPRVSTFGFAAQLQERAPGGPWTTLTGDASPVGLGPFQPAASGAVKMVRRINVRGLRMGHAYRLRVGFRWSTAAGWRSVERTSLSCTVGDLRPNMTPSAGTVWMPGPSGGQVVYRVPVRTTRATALLNSDVTVVVRQGETVLASGSFRPRSGRVNALVGGKRCTTDGPITVEVNPGGAVDERDERDNSIVLPCRSVTAAVGGAGTRAVGQPDPTDTLSRR